MNTANSARLFDDWFVGRDEYLQEFMAWLRGEKDYRVLFLHGPGGIGKTWLLRKMVFEALEADLPDLLVIDNLIDMYATSSHSVEGVREQLISRLGEANFSNFRRRQEELAIGIQQDFGEDTLSDMRQRMRCAFFSDCRKFSTTRRILLFFDTFERVQRDRVGRWLLRELAVECPNLWFVVASREKWRISSHIKLLEVKGFSKDEARQYFQLQNRRNDELLSLFYKKSFGHPLRIALATKYLEQRFLQDASNLEEYSPEEFDKAIVVSMRGLGQTISTQHNSFESLAHYILPYLAYFNQRFNHELIFLISAKPDMLGSSERMWEQEDDVRDFLEKFQAELPFVKTRPDGFVQLHDAVVELTSKYWWPEIDFRGDMRRELAEIACGWYDELLERVEKETQRNDLLAEQLVYLLDANPEKAAEKLRELSLYSFVLNDLLVVDVNPERIKKISIELQYEVAKNLGERATKVYSYDKAQEFWHIAVDVAKDSSLRVDALIGLLNATHPDNLKASVNVLIQLQQEYENSVDNENKLPEILYEIGFTYSKLQVIDEAIAWYSQAQKVAAKLKNRKVITTVLNDMGYAHVMKGDYKKAGYLVKQALLLRQDWVDSLERKGAKQEEISEAWIKLGMSYNTLGQIKRFDSDLSAATGAYSEALELFRQENAYIWQVRALHSRGEAYRRIATTLYEQRRERARQDFENLAYADLTECINLCAQYNLSEEKDTAYRRMGRLLHDQALRTDEKNISRRLEFIEEARKYFQNALDFARGTHDVLEELENLTELAFLEDDRLRAVKKRDGKITQADKDRSRRVIQDLIDGLSSHEDDDPRIIQFDVFECLYRLEEGAYYYILEDYDKALSYYIDGFTSLASSPGYGEARYRQHLDHLFKQLRELENEDEEKRWCNEFIKAWKKTPYANRGTEEPLMLSQVHGKLIDRMQMHLDTAFIFRD